MSKPSIGRKAARAKKPDGHRVAKSSRSKPTPLRSHRIKSTSSPATRPSSEWTSFESVDTHRASKIRDIFENANWGLLCSDAVDCRRRQSGAQGERRARGERSSRGLTCNISRDRFASGASNLVLEVTFSDSTYWVVRIRFPDNNLDVERDMQSEVATMRLIQERTSIPVPTVFGYNAAQCNPFGYQYMFMSALPGRHLDGPLASSVPLQYREKVADQLADILHQLSTKLLFKRIGRVWQGENGEEEPGIISFYASGAGEGDYGRCPVGPFPTSLEYFYVLRQNENAAVRSALLQGDLGEVEEDMWLAACRIFEQALCSLVFMEKMTGPFPVQHVDLQFNNFLFDNDYNITSLLDWSGAQTVPCESFAVCREFITPPGVSKHVAAQYSSFRNMVQSKWKRREANRPDPKPAWSMSDVVGSTRAQLIYFSYTYGALRRSVVYAKIVGALLLGDGFSLDTIKTSLGVH